MIGALVAIISLNTTLALVQGGVVAGSFPITGATATTPIAITSPAHGVPPGRRVHAVVDGVTGMSEANGLWELTPTDPNTFTLATYSAQGTPTASVGVHAYAGGGRAQFAFPDWTILLGRRNVQLSSAVASPRIVFVPSIGRPVGFEPFAGQGQAFHDRGTLEQQSMKLSPQHATDFTTFEVYIQAASSPPDPDFGDFDATQALAWTMYESMFQLVGGAVQVRKTEWVSQRPNNTGTMTQRGQQLCWTVEFQQPIDASALQFVPIGTRLELTVEPVNPGSTDPIVITIT